MKKILGISNGKIVLKDKNYNEIISFSNETEAYEYIKDNIPTITEENIEIEKDIKGSYKIILKNILGKTRKYQASNQMDETYFSVKTDLFKSIGEEEDTENFYSPNRYKIINNTCEKYLDDGITLSNEYVICKLLADITVEAVEKYLKRKESSMTIQELSNLKASLNTIINKGYETHTKNNETIDLISLRNKLGGILLNKGVIG